MPMTASAAQLAAQPTKPADPRVLSAQFSIATGSATHAAIDIADVTNLALSLVKFGALVSETLELQISVDGGVNFRTLKTYTTAQLNTTNGMYDIVPVKGTHARVYGFNTQAGNGVNARLFA